MTHVALTFYRSCFKHCENNQSDNAMKSEMIVRSSDIYLHTRTPAFCICENRRSSAVTVQLFSLHILIESMMEWPRQGDLRQVLRLLKSHPRLYR